MSDTVERRKKERERGGEKDVTGVTDVGFLRFTPVDADGMGDLLKGVGIHKRSKGPSNKIVSFPIKRPKSAKRRFK